MFWQVGERVSEESLAPGQPCFAPVQPSFAPVQQAFGPHTPKHLLHPLLTTLGNLRLPASVAGTSGCKSRQDSMRSCRTHSQNLILPTVCTPPPTIPLGPQRLKNIKISLWDWNFPARMTNFQASHPPKASFVDGEFWRSRLKISSEIEVFKPELKISSEMRFFSRFGPLGGLAHASNFRENRAKILPGKSGLSGVDWSLFRA